MNIDVLLLAAGCGTRLWPLTLDIPKALLPIYGIPLLDIHIHRLLGSEEQAGRESPTEGGNLVHHVVVNGHHLARQVEEHLAHHPECQRIAFSFEPEILGTGGAIRHARAWLETDSFVVINTDSLFAAPLEKALAFHLDSNCLITLILSRTPLWPNVLVKGSRVVDLLIDRTDVSGFTYTGCQIVSQEVIGLLPRDSFHDIRDTYRSLIRQGLLGAYVAPLEFPLLDVGTPERYLNAHRICAGDKARRYGFATLGQETRGNLANGYGFIDARACVGEGAWVCNSIVIGDAHIMEGTRVERSIVGPRVRADGAIAGLMVTRHGSVPING